MAMTIKTLAFLTSRDAAAYIGVRPNTLAVWRSTKRNVIPFLKIGTRVVKYRKADLDAYLESRVVVH